MTQYAKVIPGRCSECRDEGYTGDTKTIDACRRCAKQAETEYQEYISEQKEMEVAA